MKELLKLEENKECYQYILVSYVKLTKTTTPDGFLELEDLNYLLTLSVTKTHDDVELYDFVEANDQELDKSYVLIE